MNGLSKTEIKTSAHWTYKYLHRYNTHTHTNTSTYSGSVRQSSMNSAENAYSFDFSKVKNLLKKKHTERE